MMPANWPAFFIYRKHIGNFNLFLRMKLINNLTYKSLISQSFLPLLQVSIIMFFPFDKQGFCHKKVFIPYDSRKDEDFE